MKITHVRVSILESGPGYNNSSCALEAEIEDGEDYATVANELHAMCKSSIRGQREVERLWDQMDQMRHKLKSYEQMRDEAKRQVEINRKILLEHGKLSVLAREIGLDLGAFSADEMPF